MSLALTNSPATTAMPASVIWPVAGKVSMRTASSRLAGLSLLSPTPKSAARNTYGTSSAVTTVRSAPVGASLTDVIDVEVPTTAALMALAPPLVVTSIVAPEVSAAELSSRRTLRTLGVPW